jgi:phosphoribosyl 1,2-cyclic phosphodiesterase
MYIRFWGTRGSLPASLTAKQIREKLFRAIRASRSHDLATDEAIGTFIDGELPFAVRGGYGSNTSCIEIGQQEDLVLCDAGTGLRDFGNAFLSSEKGAAPAVFHLFLSHLHWDHIQGFPFFVPAYHTGNIVHIYSCHADTEKAFVYQQAAPCFPVPFKALGAKILFHSLDPDRSYEVAGFTVQAIVQNHPGYSYGYRFVRGDKKFIYSTDVELGLEAQDDGYVFVDFFRGADLLIFDAQYSLADAIGPKEAWGHSSNLLGVELAVQAAVKRLCLFHSEPTRDDEALDRFLAETREYLRVHDPRSSLKIDLAWDGMEIVL